MESEDQSLSEQLIVRSGSTGLVLIVDPTTAYVVKPLGSLETGTIVCSIPLVDIVAAAPDEDRLHVAVRHENVGFLIKNGNMLLTFESPGTGPVAAQYLDRCRQLLQDDLFGKIVGLFVSNPSPSKTLTHSHTY